MDKGESNGVKEVVVAVALSSGLASSWLQAAVNPTEPTADLSSGNFEITYRRKVQIQLFGLEDITFDKSAASKGDLEGSTPSCVDSNIERYEVSLDSRNDFNLTAGLGPGSDKIPYLLTYSQKKGAKDQVWGAGNLGPGVTAGNFAIDGPIDSKTCDPALDSKITVEIKEADYTGKPEGVYSDTVTVTVSSI
ncbi:hypothetical protein [Endozoicomonas sp. ONNA1]|uniref:hypothetical protein n=1 Tax=Endozoicomonas sp. ONNA1 TaxID=2828740 RepID=UPI002147B285|nr:hypothetical protein [Endozoicomonas sp. ONNA1]